MDFPRWRRPALNFAGRNIVYVVVKFERSYIARGMVDSQPEVEVLGVFASRNDADICASNNSEPFSSSVVIHETMFHNNRVIP